MKRLKNRFSIIFVALIILFIVANLCEEFGRDRFYRKDIKNPTPSAAYNYTLNQDVKGILVSGKLDSGKNNYILNAREQTIFDDWYEDRPTYTLKSFMRGGDVFEEKDLDFKETTTFTEFDKPKWSLTEMWKWRYWRMMLGGEDRSGTSMSFDFRVKMKYSPEIERIQLFKGDKLIAEANVERL